MKSAYELAMERMNRESGPQANLSDEQKTKIASIDGAADAKVAETRLVYEPKIAVASGEERAELERQLADEVRRIDEKREHDKESVWKEAGQK
jgi:hypothetical protein